MKKIGSVLILLSSAAILHGQTIDDIYNGFRTVADTARTKVWWFHGENITTREGITADLEAYKRAGVGGVVYYDQQHGPGAPGAAPSMSAEWWAMLKFAAQEARRIGLSFEINISNGYVCGGPWITPELGMQAVYSSDTLIGGGLRYKGKLPSTGRKGEHDIAVMIARFAQPFTARSLSYRSNGYSKGRKA